MKKPKLFQWSFAEETKLVSLKDWSSDAWAQCESNLLMIFFDVWSYLLPCFLTM